VRKILVLLALGLLVLAASCETLNVGGSGPVTGVTFETFSISPATGLFAGDTVTATITFTDPGTGPYTLSFNMGNGADPNTGTIVNASSPFSQTFTLSNPAGGTFTASATITDSNNVSDTISASYTYGPQQNAAPTIESVVDNGDGTVTVTTADADGDDVTVTLSGVAGGTADPLTGTVSGGNGSFTFSVSPEDFLAGGTITGNIEATDAAHGAGDGATDSFSASADGIVLAADTLYAIPLKSSAASGEAVRIVVATGVPASPFQFMNGVRVTAPAGFTYVDDSFDIGTFVPGTDFDQVDGIWTAVNPGSFLTAPDSFIVETVGLADPDSTGATGRTGIDFNVTPLGGSDVTSASGPLFSFEATFGNGANQLAFQEVGGVNRTYYTDSNAAPEHFWSDIDNDNGVANTVTVN
jgi:hypothetical protein